MRALFLSAGFGTRLRPLTEVLAKPAIPFLNVPMLGYPLYLAEQAGVQQAIVNLHHLPKTVEKTALSLKTPIELSFSLEQPEILDSGGGIKNVESSLSTDDHFWVLNGDTVCLFDSANVMDRIRSQHLSSGAVATILVCPFPKNEKKLGGVLAKEDNLTIDHFSKAEKGTGLTPYHYIGVCLFSKKIFEFLPQGQPSNIFYDGVTKAIDAGLHAEVVISQEARWFETGNEQDYLAASRSCLQTLAGPESPHKNYLESVLSRFSPDWKKGFKAEDCDILLSSPNARLPEDIVCNGTTVIGENVSIANQVTLDNSTVLPGTTVVEGASVSNKLLFG